MSAYPDTGPGPRRRTLTPNTMTDARPPQRGAPGADGRRITPRSAKGKPTGPAGFAPSHRLGTGGRCDRCAPAPATREDRSDRRKTSGKGRCAMAAKLVIDSVDGRFGGLHLGGANARRRAHRLAPHPLPALGSKPNQLLLRCVLGSARSAAPARLSPTIQPASGTIPSTGPPADSATSSSVPSAASRIGAASTPATTSWLAPSPQASPSPPFYRDGADRVWSRLAFLYEQQRVLARDAFRGLEQRRFRLGDRTCVSAARRRC